jgi:hypothetical protein
MQSAKVAVSDTATASQYNNLREDAMQAGYYPIDVVKPDATNGTTSEEVDDARAVGFAGSGSSICYFTIQIPELIDTSEDWEFRLGFDMATAESSKAVRFSLDYAVVDDSGDTTPSMTTLAETVNTDNTAETLQVETLATIKIPSASLTAGSTLICKFSRLADHAGDTHTGKLRMFDMQLFQNQS